MITKVTVLDSVQFLPDAIGIRFKKQTMADGEVIVEEYHRSTYQPGWGFDEWLAIIQADLARMGYAALSDNDRERLRGLFRPA